MEQEWQAFLGMHMSQCITKEGLYYDVILTRKEHYDVIAVYFSICTSLSHLNNEK